MPIEKKQVLVNGKIETSAKMQIDENQDEIWVNNRVLVYERFVYYLLNKPKGVISATEDDQHRTVWICWMKMHVERSLSSWTT